MGENLERASLTEAVFYILLSLYQPIHGYGIMKTVDEWSGGRVVLGAGTLYGALNTLMDKSWIEACAGTDSRKKEYVITSLGREQLMEEVKRLEERLSNAHRVLVGDKG